MTNQQVTGEQWVARIAEKSGREVGDVERLFAANGIAPRLTKPIPRRLSLETLEFTGEKPGDFGTKEIKFSRHGMGSGLHAFVSEGNFKGKTTLLKMVRWLMTGSYDLPADMAGWFRTALLRFRVDDEVFEVSLRDVVANIGTLSSIVRGKQRVIADFSDAKTFAAVMDRFFLDKLGLEPLIAVADRGDAVEQRHGWNWLFTAMVIDPAPDVLFGSDINHGKPTRMMQMYLGIPWVLTRADLMAAKKRVEADANMGAKVDQEFAAATDRRLADLRTSRDSYATKLQAESSITDMKRRSLEAQNAYLSAASTVQKLTPMVNEAQNELDASEAAVTEAIRDLNRFRESQAAGRIFRKLKPVSCPSCEEAYTDDYRQTKEEKHDCVVCGRHETKAGDPPEGAEEAMAQAVEEARDENRKRRKHFAGLKQKMTAAVNDRDTQDRIFNKLETDIKAAQLDSSPEIEIIKIDAQIAELERLVKERKETSSGDGKIWDTAIEQTKRLYDDEQREVLDTVSKSIATFAQSFGMTDLVSVDLKGNAAMDVRMKGGGKTFSKCTPGERMRLKTAATLALIQVSEDRGIGNHPGILFVDSVANNEITDKDVAEIVGGLAKLRDVLPDVQIFVAGVASDAILDHVPCDNVVKNREDGYLW